MAYLVANQKACQQPHGSQLKMSCRLAGYCISDNKLRNVIVTQTCGYSLIVPQQPYSSKAPPAVYFPEDSWPADQNCKLSHTLGVKNSCTIMHLYMKGTAQGISAIHPSGSFELSIYPRVYGCQATNASPLALVITNSVCNCIMVQVTCTMGF